MWDYSEAGRLMIYRSIYTSGCICCQSALLRLPAQMFEVRHR